VTKLNEHPCEMHQTEKHKKLDLQQR